MKNKILTLTIVAIATLLIGSGMLFSATSILKKFEVEYVVHETPHEWEGKTEYTVYTVPHMFIDGFNKPHGIAEMRRKSDNKLIKRVKFDNGLTTAEEHFDYNGELEFKLVEGDDFCLHRFYKTPYGAWIEEDRYPYMGWNIVTGEDITKEYVQAVIEILE